MSCRQRSSFYEDLPGQEVEAPQHGEPALPGEPLVLAKPREAASHGAQRPKKPVDDEFGSIVVGWRRRF